MNDKVLTTKAVFRRKEVAIEATDCVVEKVIRLSGAEFDAFSQGLLRDWDFIRDNPIDLIVDADGRHHCLLVVGDGRRDGILVNSEGGTYARYSALLPNADSWLTAELGDRKLLIYREESPACSVTKEAMNAYGYLWEGMESLDQQAALARFDGGDAVYLLYPDDTEAVAENRADIEKHDGLFGYEIGTPAPQKKLALKQSDVGAYGREIAVWLAAVENNPASWREDNRYRRHKDGTFYYLGDESGQYMRLANDGKLTVGRYKFAKPGIADAVLVPDVTKNMDGYERAVLLAAQIGGTRFLSDLDGMTKYAPPETAQEKLSVLEQLRAAKKNPQPHKPKADRDKGKGGAEL